MQSEWDIAESGFPRHGNLESRIHYVLRYAVLAPSSHNSQPWRFQVGGNVITLLADRTRSLPVVDPYDRELTISLGAALFNLRAALVHFGMAYAIDVFPVQADADIVARVTVQDKPGDDAEVARLVAAIALRSTNRQTFSPIELPDKVRDMLCAAAVSEGVAACAVSDPARRNHLADLVARADQAQFEDVRFRRELAAWIHPGRQRDGLSAYAFGMPHLLDFEATVTGMVLRTFDVGGGVAARNATLVAGSPLLLCLSTRQDNAPAWLFAGQAMQRILLTAKLEGYDASFLSQAIEVPALRQEMRNFLDTEPFPQLLLRIGRGPAAPHSPRRPVAEVLL